MTKQSRRILFLLDQLNLGGAQQLPMRIKRHLDPLRYRVLICPMVASEMVSKKTDGVLCLNARLSPWRPVDLDALRRLYMMLREEQVDILHTINPYSGIMGRVVGSMARTPVIVSSEQNPAWSSTWKVRAFNEATLMLADAVVFCSRGVADSYLHGSPLYWKRRGQERVIIHNGIDLEEIDRRLAGRQRDQIRRTLGIKPDVLLACYVSRFTQQKGHEDLLEALAMVRRRHPSVELLCIGWGENEGKVRRIAEGLELGAAVHFLGKREDAVELLPAADFFVSPSRWEGLPHNLLEAMAARLPVIASAVPGNNEVIEEGRSGFLVPARDAQALAEAITALVGHSDQRQAFAERGRQRVEALFTAARMNKAYQELYQVLLTGNATNRA